MAQINENQTYYLSVINRMLRDGSLTIVDGRVEPIDSLKSEDWEDEDFVRKILRSDEA